MCYLNGCRITRAEYIRLMAIEEEIKNLLFLNRPAQSGFGYLDRPVIYEHLSASICGYLWDLIMYTIGHRIGCDTLLINKLITMPRKNAGHFFAQTGAQSI